MEASGPPRFLGNPAVPVPCSPTPAGPTHQAITCVGAAPAMSQRRLPREIISGLNRTALALAVYASSGRLPAQHARLASGCWPALPGGIGYPQGSMRKVSEVLLTSLPPFPSFPGADPSLFRHPEGRGTPSLGQVDPGCAAATLGFWTRPFQGRWKCRQSCWGWIAAVLVGTCFGRRPDKCGRGWGEVARLLTRCARMAPGALQGGVRWLGRWGNRFWVTVVGSRNAAKV